MAGVETRTRLQRLQALEARTRHELQAATVRADVERTVSLRALLTKVEHAIAAETGRPGPARPRTRATKVANRVDRHLKQLGVTAHDVKVWAVSVGLLDRVRRGRIKGDVVDAYARHHQPQDGAA